MADSDDHEEVDQNGSERRKKVRLDEKEKEKDVKGTIFIVRSLTSKIWRSVDARQK